MNNIHRSDGELSTSFSMISDDQHRLAIAELSVMPWSILEKDLHAIIPKIHHHQPWYYFNRIRVPDHFQPQHVSLLLYKEIAAWADAQGINIYNDISPYGRLSAQQIYRVESLFGFRQISSPHPTQTIATIRLTHHA